MKFILIKMRVVSDLEDFQDIITNHQYVMVDFSAEWCGPCKRIKPFLESLEKKYKSIFFCVVDVDQCEDVSQKYKVECMPTFLFFKQGVLQTNLKITGASEDKITNSLESFLPH